MRFCLTILLFLITPLLFADKTDSLTHYKRHNLSLDIGIHQRSYFGKGYITPYFDTLIEREISIPSAEYYSFSYDNNVSWHFGIHYHYTISKIFKLNSGIEFINRRTVLTSPPDSVLKYQIPHAITKYIFNDMFFEIPLFIVISYKRLNFDIGGNFSTFRIKHNTNFTTDGSRINLYRHWYKDVFYPAIRISYEVLETKKYGLRVYTGLDRLNNAAMKTSAKAYDFRLGTIFLF